MFDIGRVCIKIAGRDAGKKCVIIKSLDDKFYLIDGETRRRKCNALHLEPTEQMLDLKEDASHHDVAVAFKDLGIEVIHKKTKSKSHKPKKTKLVKKEKSKK